MRKKGFVFLAILLVALAGCGEIVLEREPEFLVPDAPPANVLPRQGQAQEAAAAVALTATAVAGVNVAQPRATAEVSDAQAPTVVAGPAQGEGAAGASAGGPPTFAVQERTTVYSGPGLEYEPYFELGPGQSVTLLGRSEDGNWLAVPGPGDGSGPLGWISNQSAGIRGAASSLPVLEPGATNGLLGIIQDETAIRLGPSELYMRIGTLFAGDIRLFSGQDETGAWLALEIPQLGRIGWIPAAAIEQAGEEVDIPVLNDIPAEPELMALAPPATSASASGRVGSDETASFVFPVQAGQTIHIEVTSPGGAANFALTGSDDGQPLKRIVNEDRIWSGIAPLTQFYQIDVTAGGGSAAFTISVILE